MRDVLEIAKSLIHLRNCAKAYAATVEDVAQHKDMLDTAYRNWKSACGIDYIIERNGSEWKAMMLATEPQYRALLNAKARKRRAEVKLLKATKGE